MKAERAQAPVRLSAIFAAYYAVLVAFFGASFFPEYRIWGVNWWAYFPDYVPFVLFAIGAVAPIVMRLVLRRGESDVGELGASADSSSKYFIIVGGLTVLYALAFYLLRAKTHFLGDGYTALSSLASDNPLVKPRGLGESLVHIWVKSAIGGDAEAAALLSFQAISISAGVLFLVAVALVSKWLFERTIDRVLFWLGLASGGYMLLFFGYVENYSLFVLSVGVYSLMGLLVVKRKINRWLILPVLGLAVFFHTMGVTLIPSAVYLLVANSKLGNTLAGLNNKTKLLMGAITVVIFVSLFYYFYSTDYFFRFAFMPLFENRFTVEGYTLFSSKHLLDYFNLLILLLPGLPLVVVTLFFLPLRKIFKQRAYRYLLILLVSTLGAVFIFDPKLGMPRDWDLFSFCGVPLMILSYYIILDNRRLIRPCTIVSTLAVLLGFLSLFPRAASQVVPEISVAHFKNYSELDRIKSRTSRLILIDFYREAGDEEKAQLEREQWRVDFPEKRLVDSAVVLIKTGHPLEAVPLLRQVLKINPLYADAWLNLGTCYMYLQDYDLAINCLIIANGLNPYNAQFLNDLGTAYLYMANYQRAEKALKQSVSFDTTLFQAIFNLVQLYALQNAEDKYHQYFLKLVSRSEASAELLKALGDSFLRRKDYKRAAEAYRVAAQKGLDSSYLEKLIEKYPQLRQ